MPVLPTSTTSDRGFDTGVVAVAVTVTTVAPAPSPTLDGDADSVNGGSSSSVRVMLVPVTVRLVPPPATPIVSPPSQVVSCVGVSVNVPVPPAAFAAIVIVKFDTAV